MKKEVKYVLTQLESKIENFLSHVKGIDKSKSIEILIELLNRSKNNI